MPQKRSRSASPVSGIDGRDDATGEEQRALLSDDDGERTLSDLREPRELNVVVAESSVRRRTGIPKKVSFERAGLQLRAIRLLKDEESRREALPTTNALKSPTAWNLKRLRSLAFHCKLRPALGLARAALLEIIETFRRDPREPELNETPPPRSVDLDAQLEEQPGDPREETARLHALEMAELLATVEEEERAAEAAGAAQAARERAEEDDALAAVRAFEVRTLRERLSAARRAKAQHRPLPRSTPAPLRPLTSPFPLLTASREARMDTRIPRLPEEPEGLQAAPPPSDPRTARRDAESGLVVRDFPLLICALPLSRFSPSFGELGVLGW